MCSLTGRTRGLSHSAHVALEKPLVCFFREKLTQSLKGQLRCAHTQHPQHGQDCYSIPIAVCCSGYRFESAFS